MFSAELFRPDDDGHRSRIASCAFNHTDVIGTLPYATLIPRARFATNLLDQRERESATVRFFESL